MHYLRDEPVEASPPSTAYLLKKFAHRHRAFLATAAAFVALLLGSVVVTTGLAISASRARDLAEKLRQKADAERQIADAERLRANENAQSATNEAERARRAQAAAETARREEAAQRKNAQSALEQSRRSLYLTSIALAERNWQANNPKRAGELLDACPERYRDWEWHYLYRLVHSEVMSLPGENAAYSPDGELLATSNHGKGPSIQIWNARSGKYRMSLQGGRPVPFVQSVIFSPDSRHMAAICEDRAIRIWNVASGRQTLEVAGATERGDAQGSAPSPRRAGLLTGRKTHRACRGGVGEAQQAGLTPDNVIVWDASTGKELLKVADTGRSVAFSPDGTHLAITNCDFGAAARPDDPRDSHPRRPERPRADRRSASAAYEGC